ncbi:MAG: nuclear transport factor 2 family protein [Rhodococcus sp. (in: high G+C Gram-positive bacteria)]
MVPAADVVRKTVDAYVQAVAHGTVDDILALYADGATVEDPVGTEVRTTEQAIREFYAVLEPLEQSAELLACKIASNSAAFYFRLVSKFGENTFEVAPIDVMEFDDDGRITSMRAYWSPEDLVQLSGN